MRRFQVAVSLRPDLAESTGLTAYSDNMFVHNNSKHGRKIKKFEPLNNEGKLFGFESQLSRQTTREKGTF